MAEPTDDNQDGGKKLAGLIDDLDDQVDGQDSLAVGDILDAFGTRAFGPLMALPGLVMVTPLGGIPGMPVIVSTFVVLIAAQHLFGRDHPWLPKKLTDRSISKDKWEKTKSKVRPWARRIDWLLRPRLQILAGRVMERVISVVIIVLALSMLPIGFVPFAVAAPGAAILLFGLALSARDGVVVILGLLATGVSGYLVWTTVF